MIRPFWANPVVVCDLRARMRRAKSYWHQAAYLLLLGLFAVAGYASAVAAENEFGGGMSVVDVQRRLQGFYYLLFMTLAASICLIAPALTAASVTTERQRRTLDLLITTPLTSGELLLGKLISSVAFLALLLSLSLPASALCVILGGATLGDVLRVYLLLAIDGLVLSAIGIYFSCAVEGNMAALTWTYLSVIAYNCFTLALGANGLTRFVSGGGNSPAAVLAALNPFVAVYIGGGSFELGGVLLPIVVGTAAAAFLLIRLFVTAASYRMGNYGGNPVGSLRRQLLGITGLGAVVVAMSASGSGALLPAIGGGFHAGRMAQKFVEITLTGFLLAVPFWPSLFAPAHNADAPREQSFRSYCITRAFHPDHSGALPYFHLWLSVLAACTLGSLWFTTAPIAPEEWGPIVLVLYYLSGLGFLFWALARRAFMWVQSLTATRALTFGFYVLLFSFPVMYVTMTDGDWGNNPIAHMWVLYPLTVVGEQQVLPVALWWAGTLSYALGILVFPFWRRVIARGLGSPLPEREKK